MKVLKTRYSPLLDKKGALLLFGGDYEENQNPSTVSIWKKLEERNRLTWDEFRGKVFTAHLNKQGKSN